MMKQQFGHHLLRAAMLGAAVLALGAPACSRSPRSGNEPIASGGEKRPPRRPPQLGPAAHLPFPAFEGWTMTSNAETYGPADVAQLAEESSNDFKVFGFSGAAAAEYRNAGVPEATLRLEVFDMGSRVNAFGYLAKQVATLPDPTDAEAPGVLEIREAGVISPGRLAFFRGPYYIRLIYRNSAHDSSDERVDADTREHLPPLARHLARAIPGTSELPDEVARLPRKRRVRRSEQYHPEHLLDLAELGPGFSSLYGDPGPRFRLGVATYPEEARATSLFRKLGGSLEDAQPLPELGDEAIRGAYRSPALRIVAARRGATLAVTLTRVEDRAPRLRALTATVAAALDPATVAEEQPRDPRPWRRKQPPPTEP